MSNSQFEMTLDEFLRAEVPQKRHMLETMPGLLSPNSVELLRQIAAAQDEYGVRLAVEAHADLISACIIEGVNNTFEAIEQDDSASEDQRAANFLDAKINRIFDIQSDRDASQEILLLCDEVLSELDARGNSNLSATLQGIRATALQSMGQSSKSPEVLQSAIEGFDKSLEVFDRNSTPELWVGTMVNRINTIQILISLSDDTSALEELIATCEELKRSNLVEPKSPVFALIQMSLANTLSQLGDQKGESEYLTRACVAYDAALSVYDNHLDTEKIVAANYNKAFALYVLSRVLDDMDYLDQALECLNASLLTLNRESDPQMYARISKRYARYLKQKGEFGGDISLLVQAVENYVAVIEVYHKEALFDEWARMHIARADTLADIGELISDRSAIEDAINGYDQAARHFTAKAAPLDWALIQMGRGRALRRLAEITLDADSAQLAITCIKQAIEVTDYEAEPRQWAAAQVALAGSLAMFADLSNNPSLLREALFIADKGIKVIGTRSNLDDRSAAQATRAYILISIGNCLGDPTALDEAKRASALNSQGQRSNFQTMNWFKLQNNLAFALQSFGRMTENPDLLAEAISIYDALIDILSKKPIERNWVQIHENRATALMFLGVLSDNKNYFIESLKGHAQVVAAHNRDTDPFGWADAKKSYATSIAAQGQKNSDLDLLLNACGEYDECLEVFSKEASPDQWAGVLKNMAFTLISVSEITGRQDHFGQALDALRSALEVLTMESSPDQCMSAVSSLVRLLVDRGDFDEARSRLDEALEGGLAHLVRVENRAARERAIEQAAGLAELRAWIAIAKDADAGTALTYLERGRAQLLALSLAEDPEKAFAKGLAELGDLLAAIPAEGAAVLPIIGPAGAQVAVVPGGRTSVTPEDFLDLPELTRTRFQGWFFGPEDEPGLGGYLRAYQEGRLAWADPHAEPELARLFPETLSATLAEVWVHLLGPVDARLAELGLAEGAPVAIMPPGLMGLVPLWAAAPEDGAPFGSRWTVSLAPSLTALRAARKRSAGWEEAEAPVRTLAVLDPASEGQRRLPGAALEGGLLAQILGPDQVTALGGDDATAAAMTDAMPGRSHLHLSMHGFFSPNLPDQSALLLAGEDRLTLRALQELEAAEQLRLVVLSACDSGLPGLQRGRIDEFIGLPAGFLQAGAAAVIASHWPVRDDAAFFLMWRFYREYLDETGRERQSPAAALKAASLWLRDVTLGELATLFEPAQDADGPVPFTIDRSKPRQTPEPKADRAPPATALTLDAHLRAAPSRHKPADEAPKGPVNDALYDRIDRVKKDNANVYILDPSGKDPTHHKPFNAPTLWAAFSVTGV